MQTRQLLPRLLAGITFEWMLEDKYGRGTGHDALQAWKIATNSQLKFAAFHMGTADAQYYSEGFSDWGVNVSAS